MSLPRLTGALLLFDANTKVPLAIMDAQVISAVRTGAASGVAARYLVDPQTSSVGLLGAGVNMRTQLASLRAALPHLRSVTVYSPHNSRHAFAEEMSQQLDLSVQAAESAREVVEGHTFIVTCAGKARDHELPLFEDAWLPRKGVTIFNVSALDTPLETVARMDRLVSDKWQDSKHRGGQSLPIAVERGLVSEERIEDLGTIVAASTCRSDADENILFCPVGMASEDALIAARVYRNALRQSLGTKLYFWQDSKWT